MRALHLRSLLVTVVVFGAWSAVSAQRPTPAQAQQMLQNNPALVEQLKQRIMTSGMTPDQVRARLRAEGYPEHMLDAYLPGGGSGADSAASTQDVFNAVQQLGIADSVDMDLIRCGYNLDSLDVAESPTTAEVPQEVTPGTLRNPAAVLAKPRGAETANDSTAIKRRRRLLHDACRARIDSLVRPDVMAKQRADSGFNLFGIDFFRRQSNVFAPNTSGAVDPNYRLGPGDRLVLILTGDVEESYTLDVTREGFIVIPQVGQISVNNLTLAQLEDVLYSRLGRVYSGVRRGGGTTRFSISTAKIRNNLVYVTGDVLRPGAYQVSAAGTLLNALYAAGGPSDNGSLRDVQVRRAGRTIAHMDFYDYLVNGDASRDIRLESGDVVFIPVHLPRVRIVGEITRPATYEIKPTETLADAIRIAGGFKETASRGRVQIERTLPPNERSPGRDRVVVDVQSDAFVNGTGPTVPVHAGDVIRAFPITSRVHNRVYVRGNVNSPGPIGLTPGMTLSSALKLAGGLRPDTYLGRVLITRLQPDSTRVEMRAILRDTSGAVLNDMPLQEDDEVRVFSITEFRPARYVNINGAVLRSGQYAYREGMTMRDLVLLAGGLEQSAYLNEAKIARLPEDRTTSRTAVEFSVSLDSSYLFERGPDGKYLGPPGLPAPAGTAPEVELKPYDNVLILRQPNWELQRTVAVAGEVRFPGRYSLVNKNEKITDLLKRAGGLTPEAYANGVTFVRTRNGIGRIGIELPDVLDNPKDRDNLLLQDGDSIFIPRYVATVSVQGAVNSPVAVTWVPGRDLNYYVRAAGGPSRKADTKRAYVTQPNGKVDAESKRFLIPDYIPKPKPGSVVYVPERDPADKPLDPLAVAGAIGGILSSLVAVVIAIVK